MTHSFSTPILAVTADAVRDIQGGEALSGLWTLFTKCKESLQDGPRLENISWRLWYREMTREKQAESGSFESLSFSEKEYFSVKQHSAEHTSARIDHEATRCPQRPASVRRNSSVGRIICDMLSAGAGAKVEIGPRDSTETGSCDGTSSSPSPAMWTAEIDSVPALQLPPSVSIQTGSTEEPDTDGLRSGTTTVTSSPVLTTSAYGRRRTFTPSSASGPRVVVLTPTPNMTPHPTPPQTPIMTLQNSKDAVNERVVQQEPSTRNYLLPSAAIGGPSLSRSRMRASVSPPDSHSSSAYSSSGSSDQSAGAPSTTTSYPSPTLTNLPVAPDISKPLDTVVQISQVVVPSRSPQSTLRPSDRRFFLQQSPDADLSSEQDQAVTWETAKKDAELEQASVRSDASRVSAISRASDASAVTSDASRTSKSKPKQKSAGRPTHGKRLGLQRPPLSRHTSLATDSKVKLKTNTQKIEVAPVVLNSTSASSNDRPVSLPGPAEVNHQGRPQTKRPTFNIGSGSSRSESTDAHRTKGKGKEPVVSKILSKRERSSTSNPPTKLVASKSSSNIQPGNTAKFDVNLTAILPSTNRKRLILESTSSEYETESGSWTGSESFSDTDHKAAAVQSGRQFVEEDEGDWASDESEPSKPQPVLQNVVQERAEAKQHSLLSRESRAQAERERRAEEERERDRQLFAKVPQRSYSQNLINQRSKSGLLSQLLKPNPDIFPQGHFFRVQSGLDLPARVAGGLSMTRMSDNSKAASGSGTPKRPALRTSKSAAAVSLAAVNIGGEPSSRVEEARNGQSPAPNKISSGSRRPPDVEYDTESADEDDDDERKKNSIQVSESLAHRKLAAFAGRMNLKGQASERVKAERPPSAPGGNAATAQLSHNVNPSEMASPMVHRATAPIGFPPGHPYNFTPDLPTTPRTTRRAMLQTEMSESVRRNLLWERRSATTNGSALKRGNSAGNVLGGGLVMTRIPSMVQLTAKTANGGSTKSADPDNFEEDGRTHGERAAHKRAMARNRSWGDNDYHKSGW